MLILLFLLKWLRNPVIIKTLADLEFFQKLEQETGVHIEWNMSSEDGWKEKKGLLFAGELPDAFYGAAGRMNGKYREFLISAADRMKAGTGEKLSQICRECAESALEKKLPYPWGKGRFFFFRRISGLYGSGNADATAFPV